MTLLYGTSNAVLGSLHGQFHNLSMAHDNWEGPHPFN